MNILAYQHLLEQYPLLEFLVHLPRCKELPDLCSSHRLHPLWFYKRPGRRTHAVLMTE